ncbi:FAD/NAD(P)-binding protein [bacterium]|nr:FAD/NAD(P)-binding protein [bacterium]
MPLNPVNNPYLTMPVRIVKVSFESEDRSLKTLELQLINEQDRSQFHYLPGQFIEFSIPGKGESPFGIASSPSEDVIRVTVNRTGYVTESIHQLEEGDFAGIRGPFGNTYPLDLMKQKRVIIISGGFAFTTLSSLLDYLLEHEEYNITGYDLIYGARNPGMLLYKDKIECWKQQSKIKSIITIDRETPGWTGTTGFVPTIVEQSDIRPDQAIAVICGPPIMIKLTLPKLLDKGFQKDQIFTSLERRMKCGIGKCGRCNIGPNYVCKDGPVFSLQQLEGLPAEY